MEIFRNKKSFTSYIQQLKKDGKTVGFAPTMGALHQGHLSLYKMAKAENEIVISSIFVNPTQFNNPNDLNQYPRDIDKDIELLKSVAVDAVYIPSVEDIYPGGLQSQKYNFNGLEDEMEGKFRPGHFDGVGTVVAELFRQVQPDKAYFGEKDFQQLAIIKNLVQQLDLPIKIVGVPTYREDSGLAMSSRNLRLTENQKQESLVIYHTLKKVKEWFGQKTIGEIRDQVNDIFAASNLDLEYFTIVEETSLKETTTFQKNKCYRAFLVAHAGDVRLIDNMKLNQC